MSGLMAKAVIEMDGQDIELIIKQLEKGVEEHRLAKQEFRAKQLEHLIQKMCEAKLQFHQKWLNYFKICIKQKNPLIKGSVSSRNCD